MPVQRRFHQRAEFGYWATHTTTAGGELLTVRVEIEFSDPNPAEIFGEVINTNFDIFVNLG